MASNIFSNPFHFQLFLIQTSQSSVIESQQEAFAAFRHIGDIGICQQGTGSLNQHGTLLSFLQTIDSFSRHFHPERLFLIDIDCRKLSVYADILHPIFHITVESVGIRAINGIARSRAQPQISGCIFLNVFNVIVRQRSLVIFLATVDTDIVTVIPVQSGRRAKPHESV